MALTLILAFSLIVSGILRAWFGIRLRSHPGVRLDNSIGRDHYPGRYHFRSAGPANTAFLLGIVLAINLTLQGISSIGFAVRKFLVATFPDETNVYKGTRASRSCMPKAA